MLLKTSKRSFPISFKIGNTSLLRLSLKKAFISTLCSKKKHQKKVRKIINGWKLLLKIYSQPIVNTLLKWRTDRTRSVRIQLIVIVLSPKTTQAKTRSDTSTSSFIKPSLSSQPSKVQQATTRRSSWSLKTIDDSHAFSILHIILIF